MTTQMKLTDAVLRELADALASIDHPWAADYVEAILALRDAAMAVCDSSRKQWGMGYSICCAVDEDKVDELRKLLPKKH
jgi:hypothetical protein